MNKKELILTELEQIPEPLLEEVLQLVRSFKGKTIREKLVMSIISESSLQKDWLRPEEDEAWQDL